jgi:hypothetical protein
MTLDMNLGQVVEIVTFVATVVWAHTQMASRVDGFLETLKRHEGRLDAHDERLNQHGEALASLRPRGLGPH